MSIRRSTIRVNRRRKKNPFIPALLLLLVALLTALVVALLWQLSTTKDNENVPASSDSTSIASTSQLVTSSSEPEPEPEPAPPVFEGAVPASERVHSSYFDDAVFIGDSITTGISLYGVMSNTNVIAETGANLATVYTKEVIKQEDDSRITIMAALAQKKYRKIYVMLGGNEVRDEEKEVFIKRYAKLIDELKRVQPDAVYYIQSILPVTKVNNYNMTNPRIDEFNEALLALCLEKNVYYLNVAECMKDETGMLPTAASPADGMHFGPEYYNKWFEYLKTHTVTLSDDTASESQSSSSEAGSASKASAQPNSLSATV